MFEIVEKHQNLEGQRVAYTLLQAVKESLSDQSREHTPTAFFASFMVILDQETEEVAAALYLLSLVLPQVPSAVLHTKYSMVLEVLLRCVDSDDGQILRYAMECLHALLLAQPPSVWSSGETLAAYQNLILAHVLDASPKIRKLAQLVCLKLVRFRGVAILPMKSHPSQQILVRHLSKVLVQLSEEASICHFLAFCGDLWKHLEVKNIGTLMAGKNGGMSGLYTQVLKCKNEHVSNAYYSCLNNLLIVINSKDDDRMEVSFFMKYFQCVLQNHPTAHNQEALALWLSIAVQCAKFFQSQVDIDLITKNHVQASLQSLFDQAFELLSHKMKSKRLLHEALLNTLSTVFDAMTFLLLDCATIYGKLEQGLTVQYKNGWNVVLKLLDHILHVLGYEKLAQVQTLLQILTNDQSFGQNQAYPCRKEFERVVGSLIELMKVQRFMVLFPLNMSSETPRTWLLPLLKKYIKQDQLDQFLNVFVPLSQSVAQKGATLVEQGGMDVEARMCAVVWRQIWGLLPSFCNRPQDLNMFETLCNLVVPFVTGNDERVSIVIESLKVVVTSWKDEDREQLLYLSPFAEHILTPLFDKFVSLAQEGSSSSVTSAKAITLDAIKGWCSVASTEVLNVFFGSVLQNYVQVQANNNAQVDPHSLLDLANVILVTGRVNAESVQLLYRILVLGIKNIDDTKVQKKSYKTLYTMVSLASIDEFENCIFGDSCNEFRNALRSTQCLKQLCAEVVSAVDSLDSAAKKDRFAVIEQVVDLIPNGNGDLLSVIPSLVSEVIMGTKEVNDKSRNAAYALLVQMAEKISSQPPGTMLHLPVADDQNMHFESNLSEFVKMVMAGLAGQTPHMISSSINALSTLLYQYKNDAVTESIIITVMQYALQSKSREIIKSAISFVKVVAIACQDQILQEALTPYSEQNLLDLIIFACVKWSSEPKSHFKMSCRFILERLVRKLGIDVVVARFPKEHYRLINNIRKRNEHAAKKKVKGDKNQSDYKDTSDEDDGSVVVEEDIPEILKELMISRGGKSSLEMMDAVEHEPMDLLDSKMVSMATSQRKRKMSEELVFDGSGRLLMEESDQGMLENDPVEENHYLDKLHAPDSYKMNPNGRIKYKNVKEQPASRPHKFQRKDKKSNKLTDNIGTEYRSKKGKGDIKIKGKPDPYAYIPLQGKMVGSRGKKRIKFQKN